MSRRHQRHAEKHGITCMDLGMAHTRSVAERAKEMACLRPSHPDMIEKVIEVVRTIQDRTALYQFPPVAAALARGERPALTHKGMRAYYIHRQQHRVPADWRAVEAVIADNAHIFTADTDVDHQRDDTEGMTLTEFARWAGISRTGIAQHLVEVPPGPAIGVPAGKVPTRRIAKTRRVFKSDFLGIGSPKEHQNDDFEETSSDTTGQSTWDRQISDLRDRYRR